MRKEKVEEENKEIKIEEKPEKKKINPLLIVLLIIVFVGLLIGAFILGTKFANKEDGVSKEQQYTLDIYEFTYGLCEKESTECKKIDSVPVKTKEAKILTSYEESKDDTYYQVKHILYNDETLKLYNLETKKITETNLKAEYDEYELQMSYDSKEVLGIVLYKDSSDSNDYNAYYDIKNQKKLLESQYDQIYTMRGEYIQVVQDQKDIIDRGEFDWDNSVSYVINTKTQQKIITEPTAQVSFEVETNKDKVYIYRVYHGLGEPVSAVYNIEGKTLIESINPEKWYHTSDGNVAYVNGNKVERIDYHGKILSTSKEYQNILHTDEGIILYHDNKNVYITDDKEYNEKILEWKKEYYYHSMLSGYWDEYVTEEETKPAGYYFIFEYDKNDDSGVEIYFNQETKEIKKYELEEIGGYAKPVLYLYPEEKTEVTINFEKEDNLTTTYPKFNSEWNVTAYPNGDLYDKDGKYYYGLYWEEDSNHTVNFTEGFYVSKDNAIEFLEEKLTIIGLNAKERNEFIMYWLPILEKNEHNLVYFELTEERNAFNEIEISPKPDSLLRMAIHVKKINGKQTIKEQKLETFKRNGFVAVEWGGIAYK